MTVSSQLTAELRKLVLRLEDDLRERLAQDDENLSGWKAEHQGALEAQRTSSAWQAWRDDKITQSAVAWILTTVFVRFAEDNALIRPVWISGPGSRRQEALDAQIVFFRAHPELTDREWLLEPVAYLTKLPATADLVGEHSALWQVQPSGRMATEILEFWRQTDDAGLPTFDFTDTELSTRFLGDLYQDLSDYAKKTFALLQTPEFVEEFILDQTLTPALAERPLEGFKLIDPTCGSGHFLLGAFARLTDAWASQAPGLDARARVQKALDAVHGVDLNPFAVAIARFRLTVAALKVCKESSLELAPAFSLQLAAGDSLLHGEKQWRDGSVQGEIQISGFDADSKLTGFFYATEDLHLLKRILKPGQYDVVVGNPPYIKSPVSSPNKHYRQLYKSINGQLTLTVPFMERFFGLAKHGTSSQPAGWTGQITSNSFMKREFGRKLIEDFLSRQDLRLVVDSEGAWIPGHNMDGTPTVIIVGRHQRPASSTVRVVLSNGFRESRSVGDLGRGAYWLAIEREIEHPGYSDRWIDVVDLDRAILANHPWSLSGGGASDLMSRIESASSTLLSDVARDVGSMALTRADSAYLAPVGTWKRRNVSAEQVIEIAEGDRVRDFVVDPQAESIFPYGADLQPLLTEATEQALWPFKQDLVRRQEPNGNQLEIGLTWFEWSRLIRRRLEAPLLIAFAEVATHNHFALDRGGKVFKQSAPVIQLHDEATEDDYRAISALLASSTVCFWLKQKCKAKGGAAGLAWARTYQFNGANVSDIPLPEILPRLRGRHLDTLAREYSQIRDAALNPSADHSAKVRASSLRRLLVAQQEELDWEVYRYYNLIDEDLVYDGTSLPEIALGERAFEIAMARHLAPEDANTAWFNQHGSKPSLQIPAHWPEEYQKLVQRRLDFIESDPSIRMLEKPEFKRRWASELWENQQERALRAWLLDRLEDRSLWFDRQDRPAPVA